MQLLRLKPELAEFLNLEIETMKHHRVMSRSSAMAEDFTIMRQTTSSSSSSSGKLFTAL